MRRLHNLDYLRGLAALSIMIYHLSSWIFGSHDVSTFLGKTGVYGVSVFYVLSGLTLYHVYCDNLKLTPESLFNFFKKRFFRIFPLLWVVTIFGFIYKGAKSSILDLFLNLTGLFGFFRWDVSFSVGVWSIGNELVFYSIFPFLIFLINRCKILYWIVGLIIFYLFIYFAFELMYPNMPSVEGQRNYFNPLNNLFLFFGGVTIGGVFKNIYISQKLIVFIIITSLLLYILYPVSGGRIDLITGYTRLFFTFICFALCLAFYKLSLTLPRFLHDFFVLLGEISYSTYLIHWYVFLMIKWLVVDVQSHMFLVFVASVFSTLVLGWIVYKYFEKLFIRIGNKV
jgi:exopolysaccharide production protein ExoZ